MLVSIRVYPCCMSKGKFCLLQNVMDGFFPLHEETESWPMIHSTTNIYWQHPMYGPGINLSPEDVAVNNRGKRSLHSHLNVSGGGGIFLD